MRTALAFMHAAHASVLGSRAQSTHGVASKSCALISALVHGLARESPFVARNELEVTSVVMDAYVRGEVGICHVEPIKAAVDTGRWKVNGNRHSLQYEYDRNRERAHAGQHCWAP